MQTYSDSIFANEASYEANFEENQIILKYSKSHLFHKPSYLASSLASLPLSLSLGEFYRELPRNFGEVKALIFRTSCRI